MKATKQVKRQARQLFRMCHVKGVISESRVRQVLQSVLKTKRRGYRALANQFERLVKLEQAQQTTVERATPLSPDLQTTVRERLARSYGELLNTSRKQSASFGMRIRVAGDVYDGSMGVRLEELKKNAR